MGRGERGKSYNQQNKLMSNILFYFGGRRSVSGVIKVMENSGFWVGGVMKLSKYKELPFEGLYFLLCPSEH